MFEKKAKKIILGMPENFMLYISIIKNLEYCGYSVIPITVNNSKYFYKNKRERFVNLARKVFLNDKNYKKKLLLADRAVFSRINQIDCKADFALFIRPDVYTLEILELIKLKCDKMIAYQWDGMARFPIIYSFTKYFDRFFVFDKLDYKPPTVLLPTTNFYFDYPINKPSTQICDIFYTGTYVIKRMDKILALAIELEKLNLVIQINIFKNNNEIDQKYENTKINFMNRTITYQENLEMAKNSKILLDFQDTVHQGLSFRVFESLGFEKKLITNNSKVKEYDFYHPNNIFVWDTDDDLDKIKLFINTPYFKINRIVKEKYSFSNWINYVLDIKPYTAINFP